MRAVRLSAIGELAAGVAHQINNPVSTVVADSQLLLQDLASDTLEYESAEAIHRAAQRRLPCNGCLTALRVRPPFTKSTSTTPCAKPWILMRPQRELQRMELRLEFTAAAAGRGQPEEHLLDVWMNLLLNTRDAVSGKEKGWITVTTGFDSAENAVVIAMRDNGRRHCAGVRPQLFDPFYTTKETAQG